jgi:hypothetical protein
VARCPHCGAVLATIVESDDKIWLSLAGVSAIEVAKQV